MQTTVRQRDVATMNCGLAEASSAGDSQLSKSEVCAYESTYAPQQGQDTCFGSWVMQTLRPCTSQRSPPHRRTLYRPTEASMACLEWAAKAGLVSLRWMTIGQRNGNMLKRVRSAMKRVILVIATVSILVASATPARAYTATVGSASWRNQGGYVYDETGAIWMGDDFDGSAGTALTSPPYASFEYPPIIRNGDGTIDLVPSGSINHNQVWMPNFDSSGNWLTARNADLVVNFQTGAPAAGYGFGIQIDTEGLPPQEDDQVTLSLFRSHDGSMSGLAFFDDDTSPSNPPIIVTLSDLGIEGFTSLGLRLSVDDDGLCTPYYWANPADGILGFDDPQWIQFGSATSQMDLTKFHDDIDFHVGEIEEIPAIPLPGSILLLGSGLVGALRFRRKLAQYPSQ
jgi:hypothetical protein